MMLIHLLGACCLVAAGTATGWYQAQKLRNRRILLEDILELLVLFESGICTTQTALAVLWQDVFCQKSRFQLLEIENSPVFSKDILKESLCIRPSAQKLLQPEDKILLEKWIDSLGSGTVQQEQARIQYLQNMLQQVKQTAWEKERQSGKVYLSLGVCGGLAIAVLTL